MVVNFFITIAGIIIWLPTDAENIAGGGGVWWGALQNLMGGTWLNTWGKHGGVWARFYVIIYCVLEFQEHLFFKSSFNGCFC